MSRLGVLGVSLGILMAASGGADSVGAPWQRHAIDRSSQGADGVRLQDVDGDGLLDIATGWEEGGVIRVYRNPGPHRAREPWPAVTVGRAGSPEDAVFADLDGDGRADVISASEGETRSLQIHWAPGPGKDYWNEAEWRMATLPASRNRMRWMFSAPAQIDGQHGLDFFAGGKEQGGAIGWWQAPANPRDLAAWRWHPLIPAGWVMSLLPRDMDGDGDLDLLFTDRRGAASGVAWLERTTDPGRWPRHDVGSIGAEVMFAYPFDLDEDGLEDVLAAVRPSTLAFHRRLDSSGTSWQTIEIPMPRGAGTAKAVAAGDIDLDGKPDLVYTCEHAEGPLLGAGWLKAVDGVSGGVWRAHGISGEPGTKYDLVALVDLDGDGDPDVLTCEERENLGVIWYENPAR